METFILQNLKVIQIRYFLSDCRCCMKTDMATGMTPATSHGDFALLNECSIEKYGSIEEGAIIRRPRITQGTRETFQYSIEKKKKKKR